MKTTSIPLSQTILLAPTKWCINLTKIQEYCYLMLATQQNHNPLTLTIVPNLVIAQAEYNLSCEEHNLSTTNTLTAVSNPVRVQAEHNLGLKECNPGLKEHNLSLKERNLGLKERNLSLKEYNPSLKERNLGLKEYNPSLKERNPSLEEQI